MTATTFQLKYSTNVGFCADFGGRGFQLPTSMAIRSDGVIFVASRGKATTKGSNGIQMVTRDHEFLGQFGTNDTALGGMIWPTCIALDDEDNIYLSDENLQRITKYDREGNPVTYWGEQGSGEGQFDQPSGLLIRGDNILVVDSRNNRIQTYSLNGDFCNQWGGLGIKDGEFNLPWGISEDSKGYVYVADWRNDRIQKFTFEGDHVATFGESGKGEGQLNRPAGVAIDPDGNMYIADWGNQRLQVLDSEGRFLEVQRGEAGLNPWSIEYLSSQDDERMARESFIPVYEPDTEDPSEISARMEPYLWDPVSVQLDEDGRVYVLETGRHRFQIFEKA